MSHLILGSGFRRNNTWQHTIHYLSVILSSFLSVACLRQFTLDEFSSVGFLILWRFLHFEGCLGFEVRTSRSTYWYFVTVFGVFSKWGTSYFRLSPACGNFSLDEFSSVGFWRFLHFEGCLGFGRRTSHNPYLDLCILVCLWQSLSLNV
jgi:hypothetical protein